MIRYFQILCFLLLSSSFRLTSQVTREIYSPSSLLSSGRWFKMAVTRDGIYRINFSVLKQLGLENPSNPRIFGNNKGQLSYYNDGTAPDDLEEIAIAVSKGSDGVFNEGDYLLFCGMGTGRWLYDYSTGEFDYKKHDYSDTAFYFLTSGPGPGKTVGTAAVPDSPVNNYSAVSDLLFIHENDAENLIKSGREWYEPVSYTRELTVDPGFSNLITTEQISYTIRVLARSPAPSLFRLVSGGSTIEEIPVPAVSFSSTTGTYAQSVMKKGKSFPKSESPHFSLEFLNNGQISARGWVDYIKIHARGLNSYDGPETWFTDSKSAAQGNVTELTIKSTINGFLIWDVTDPLNPETVEYAKSGENINFSYTNDSLKTFVAFLPANAPAPFINGHALPNQDLHSSGMADMVIITHPFFRDYALKLADFHYRQSGLISLVTTPEKIYNEFSGGIPDIVAIRNFLRMKYTSQRESAHPLKYLMLFGDGSYDNKTPPPGNPSYIPTWQSQNSNVVISSFTSDDFFGLLDDGEGEDSGTEDIGIGRLPVSDTVQAGIIISKIKGYLDPANTGSWKNIVSLIADDEDGNTHMSDAEGLADLLTDSIPWVNIDKIYFDAYRQVTTSTGQFYPDVSRAIDDRINTGTLIFNYTGHGNESGLGHERVLTYENIKSWNNKSRLPLFITATCEFSRFDDIDRNTVTGEITGRNSAGEDILFTKNGGGIALMSTTRLVYSAPNYQLNRSIFDAAFERGSDGVALRLGDIIRLAKIRSGGGTNKRNFLLLGDPAIRLAWPWHGKVVTDSINHARLNESSDTLKALSSVTISGHIEDLNGSLLSGFNGTVEAEVYDKPAEVETLANDGGLKMQFTIQKNLLFKGTISSSDGHFAFSFIVPREIDYRYGMGKLSYYSSDTWRDMTGSFNEIVAGGFSNTQSNDTSGPKIRLYLNDTLFRGGGITDSHPRLLAILEDDGGINSSGAGLGHDLVAWLDNDRNNPVILNNYYQNDPGNAVRGRITYDFSGLPEGTHTLYIKAWDNFNNSSVESIVFIVKAEEKFILENPLNYPNPFNGVTKISAEHNRPDEIMDITIRIYTPAGKIIRILKSRLIPEGFRLPPVEWDGNDSNGKRVAGGIYIYRLDIHCGNGETASASGRMIIL